MSAMFATLALASARLATGRLGWPPPTFWDATPCELTTALDHLALHEAGAPIDRAALARLRERFPDA